MNILNSGKIQDLMDNGFNIDISDSLNEGIEIAKAELGPFIGFTVVYFLIIMAASFLPMAGQIISPALIAGYYIFAHKIHRNEQREFNDFFKGFDYFAQLLIQQLIIAGLMILVFIPGIAALITSGALASEFLEYNLGLVGALSLMLSFIGIIYISTIYLFAPFFVIFGDYQAWDAMELSRKITLRNFWSVFGLFIVTSLVILAGFLLCFIGGLFTLPAGYATFYVAFKNLVDLDSPFEENDILDHLVD